MSTTTMAVATRQSAIGQAGAAVLAPTRRRPTSPRPAAGGQTPSRPLLRASKRVTVTSCSVAVNAGARVRVGHDRHAVPATWQLTDRGFAVVAIAFGGLVAASVAVAGRVLWLVGAGALG